jgi:mannose-1-phosphate guanylyltransferase
MGQINIVKKWGFEYIIECNPDYTMKKIVVRQGERLPNHYHEHKVETFYILYGEGTMYIDGVPQEIHTGDTITIKAKQRHCIVPKDERMEILETSTTYLTDSYREDLKC